MNFHRITCEDPDCARMWRETCEDCAAETAERHRRETGHPVHLSVVDGGVGWDMRRMTGMAHQVLIASRRVRR